MIEIIVDIVIITSWYITPVTLQFILHKSIFGLKLNNTRVYVGLIWCLYR